MNALECCARLRGCHVWIHSFALGTNGPDNLHTRLACVLLATRNLATHSGRRIIQSLNSQGMPKTAGTSIFQSPTGDGLEDTHLKCLRDKRKNPTNQTKRGLFTAFKGNVGHKNFGSILATLSTKSPVCKYKIHSFMKFCHILND